MRMGEEAYKPLKGEGEQKMMIKTRRTCDICGRPADYCQSFVLNNARRNPASKGFGKDDLSWCSDAEAFFCEEHKDRGWQRNYMEGYESCSKFPLDKFPHMGLYWKEVKA